MKQSERDHVYSQYLTTDYWKTQRLFALQRAGDRCQLCGDSSVMLDVHHNSYKNIGKEIEYDLFVLCRECHREFHCRAALSGPSLYKADLRHVLHVIRYESSSDKEKYWFINLSPGGSRITASHIMTDATIFDVRVPNSIVDEVIATYNCSKKAKKLEIRKNGWSSYLSRFL